MTLCARRNPVQRRGIAGEKRFARRKEIGIGRLGVNSGGEGAGGGEHQTAQDRSGSSRRKHQRDYRLLSSLVDGPVPCCVSKQRHGRW
jgi:hypothetical protein